jgi:hypothetical protein
MLMATSGVVCGTKCDQRWLNGTFTVACREVELPLPSCTSYVTV